MSNVYKWPAGRPFTRAHSHEFGSTEFDARADADARFSPLRLPRIAPVIYGGGDDRTAAAETIFHRLPDVGRPRRVPLDRYRAWHWSTVTADRDLALVALDGTYPQASTMVDGDWPTYPASRAAAVALLTAQVDVDGFVWCSRQLHDVPSQSSVAEAGSAVCLLLVGRVRGRSGGVNRDQLTAVGPAVPFATVAGVERLDVIGDELGVTVVRS